MASGWAQIVGIWLAVNHRGHRGVTGREDAGCPKPMQAEILDMEDQKSSVSSVARSYPARRDSCRTSSRALSRELVRWPISLEMASYLRLRI